MEILTYKLNSQTEYSTSAITNHATPGIKGRLTEFFKLSKEERLRAGIYVGKEGREWIEQSAIVIIPHDSELFMG